MELSNGGEVKMALDQKKLQEMLDVLQGRKVYDPSTADDILAMIRARQARPHLLKTMLQGVKNGKNN